jgi:D-alanyl-D-alanine carboxypeptidase
MKTGSKRAALLAALTMATSIPAAAAVPPDLAARADAYIDAAWPADGPGVAIIITDDGRTVYARGRGLANVEARTPVSPHTVFRMGSITKQFTAAVILQLAAEGRLSLDDPLSRFLPDYPAPGSDATVRQLLNHTVGVQSYTGIPGWMREENTNRAYTTAEMIAQFRDLPAPSRPGEAYAYNNSGYVLLGAIIETVTGMPWHQAVEERIARPLGLATIRYGVGEDRMPNMAAGYTADEQGVHPSQRIHMSVPHAAGALIGSVEDLARWAQALHHGRVVDPANYAQMVGPTRLSNGESVPYGFGLAPDEVRGRPAVGHGGGIFGFSTFSLYIPSEDIFIAVFANSDQPATSPDIAVRRLAGLALGDPFPSFERVDADPAQVAPLLGLYAIANGAGERRFFGRDGRYYTQRTGGPEQEVFSAGADRFFYGPESLTWFQMRRDPAGAHVMEMHQAGASAGQAAVRSGPVPPEPAVASVPRETLERYVGRYALPHGAVAVAMGEDGRLTVQLGGQRALPLRPTSATEFRVEGVDARVVFLVEDGNVKQLTIHQGGNALVAERVAAAGAG